MKTLVALDKFKGSISSLAAGGAIQRGLMSRVSSSVSVLSLADGGDGFLVSLEQPLKLSRFVVPDVVGSRPLAPTRCVSFGGNVDRSLAVIELASICGLASLPDPNPLETTTFGLGQVIASAARQGFRHIVVGLGGSSTNDAGLGALQALGFEIFLEGRRADSSLPICGKDLKRVTSISTHRPSLLDNVQVEIACDVTNPFTGPLGAVAVFSSQKGANTQAMRDLLEDGMLHVEKLLPPGSVSIPGAGAAGGTAGGLAACCGAKLISGLDFLAKYVELDARIASSDIIITGEGCFDSQSLQGKVVGRILEKSVGKRCFIVCGKAETEAPAGVELYSLTAMYGSFESFNATEKCLELVGQRIGDTILIAKNT